MAKLNIETEPFLARLRVGDKEKLALYYPALGPGKVIRALVQKHVEECEAKAKKILEKEKRA